MGQVIRIIGALWVIAGVAFVVLTFNGVARLPDTLAAMAGMWSIVTFLIGFVVPGGTMYCVGDLHHKLIAKQS